MVSLPPRPRYKKHQDVPVWMTSSDGEKRESVGPISCESSDSPLESHHLMEEKKQPAVLPDPSGDAGE